MKIWFLALCPYFVRCPGYSIRKLSLEVVEPISRCYLFIRKFIEKLSLISSSSSAKLSGIAEGEFYMKAGLKGRRYTEKTEKPGKTQQKIAHRERGKDC